MGGATDDEPTADRYGGTGLWHRRGPLRPALGGWTATYCGSGGVKHGERVPLSRVPEADRCRICWPTPKEKS